MTLFINKIVEKQKYYFECYESSLCIRLQFDVWYFNHPSTLNANIHLELIMMNTVPTYMTTIYLVNCSVIKMEHNFFTKL